MAAVTTPHSGLPRRRPWLSLGCILAGLIFLVPALAQEESTDYVPTSDPANEYLDEIDRIEAEYGPYSTELSDMYLGLGQTLMSKGEFERARDALHRGVMVERVNMGPNSPEQTNHLYMLANVEILLGEPQSADKVLKNIYFINSNYYGEDSPEMLPVLDRMYLWYSVMRPPGTMSLETKDYDRMIKLTEESLNINEATRGEAHPDTAVAYRRFADAQFQMVRHLTGSGMAVSSEIYAANTNGSLYPALGFGSDTVYKHYKAGMKAYRNYLESILANESTTLLEYAEALADLGDWFLVFEKYRKSRLFYEQSYQILAQNEETAEQAANFMSQPRPMHFVVNLQPGFLQDAPTELPGMGLDISMTVTNLGGVHNVEVLNPPEDMSDDELREIKKQLKFIPFRPALKEGEVVTTREFIWHYVIVPQGTVS